MNSFVSHPSVRIKGTENNYNPLPCLDTTCSDKSPHMHCPLCTKSESFHDPTIIKAHFRVKHVDKGLEFSGLKVLRCNDSCDIVGAIKGEKKFKGAHWHCYKCRNGFNRRDEALKHFKTHFRNPQTTFQIQVTQDVHQLYPSQQENEQSVQIISQEMLQIHSLTDAVIKSAGDTSFYTSDATANGKSGETDAQVAANETVGTTEQAIIIQEDGTVENCVLQSGQIIASSAEHIVTSQDAGVHLVVKTPVSTEPQVVVLSESSSSTGTWMQQKLDLQRKVKALQDQYKSLQRSKDTMENSYKKEINDMKLQLQMQSEEISSYQKREEELLGQLSVGIDERMQQLLHQLQIHHQDLLHQQLIQLKREFVQAQDTLSNDIKNHTMTIISEPTKESQDGETMTVIMSANPASIDVVTTESIVSDVTTSSVDVITLNSEVNTTDSGKTDSVHVEIFDSVCSKRKLNSPGRAVKRRKDNS